MHQINEFSSEQPLEDKVPDGIRHLLRYENGPLLGHALEALSSEDLIDEKNRFLSDIGPLLPMISLRSIAFCRSMQVSKTHVLPLLLLCFTTCPAAISKDGVSSQLSLDPFVGSNTPTRKLDPAKIAVHDRAMNTFRSSALNTIEKYFVENKVLEKIPQELLVGTNCSPKITLIIKRDGNLLGCGATRTSGSQEFDLAIRKAVEGIHFEPLPSECESSTLKFLIEIPIKPHPLSEEERLMRETAIERDFKDRDLRERKRLFKTDNPWELTVPYQGFPKEDDSTLYR